MVWIGLNFGTQEASTGSGIAVFVEAGKGIFPKGTKLNVSDVDKATAIEVAESQMSEDQVVEDAVGVDISFMDADGKEIEPEGGQNVSVAIRLPGNNALSGEGEEYSVVHQKNDGSTETVSANAGKNGASFENGEFSIYVITGTYYDQFHTVYDGNSTSEAKTAQTQ